MVCDKKIIEEEGLENCGRFSFSEGFNADDGTFDPTDCPAHCREGKSSSGPFISSSSGGTCIPNYSYTGKKNKNM